MVFSRWKQYAHIMLAFTLIKWLQWIYKRVAQMGIARAIERILFWSDRYSYDVYIVHHFFILGPCSILAFDMPILLKVFLVLIVTFVSAIVLNYLSSIIKKRVRL